jgi:hypothetical protein
MINKDKHTKGLTAIHELLVRGRIMAFEGTTSDEFFIFFDEMEHLPALMLEENNRTELFELCLLEICKKYQSMYIYNKYIK